MADELRGGPNAATAKRIPGFALGAIVDAMRVLAQITTQLVDRHRRSSSGWGHALEPPDYPVYLPGKEPRHRGFHPLQGRGCARPIVQLRHRVNMLRAMIVVEDLPGRGEELRDPVPNPGRAIGHDTQPHLFLRHQAGFLNLSQCGEQLLIALDLMPTEQMDDALIVHQVAAEPLGFTPLPRPARPLGSLLLAPRPAALRRIGARRDLGSVNSQHQNRALAP